MKGKFSKCIHFTKFYSFNSDRFRGVQLFLNSVNECISPINIRSFFPPLQKSFENNRIDKKIQKNKTQQKQTERREQ